MKTNKLNIFAVSFSTALALTACQSNEDKEAAIKKNQNVKESKVWIGTYEGVLPCGDCAGLRTEISLFDNGQFKKTETQVDNVDMKFSEHGEMQWNEKGNIATLINDNNEANAYQVSEEKLVMLAADGQLATGELADQYMLKKVTVIEASNPPVENAQ